MLVSQFYSWLLYFEEYAKSASNYHVVLLLHYTWNSKHQMAGWYPNHTMCMVIEWLIIINIVLVIDIKINNKIIIVSLQYVYNASL